MWDGQWNPPIILAWKYENRLQSNLANVTFTLARSGFYRGTFHPIIWRVGKEDSSNDHKVLTCMCMYMPTQKHKNTFIYTCAISKHIVIHMLSLYICMYIHEKNKHVDCPYRINIMRMLFDPISLSLKDYVPPYWQYYLPTYIIYY